MPIGPLLESAFQTALDSFLDARRIPRRTIDFRSCCGCFDAVCQVTTSVDVDRDELMELFLDTAAVLRNASPSATGESNQAAAFESAYIAHKRLFRYLNACWKHHCMHSSTYCYPYVELVQSSGFGKSRILRELAIHFTALDPVSTGLHRLLYVNVRNETQPTDYPPATKGLARYLFPPLYSASDSILVSDLAKKLVRIFELVMLPEPPASEDTGASRKSMDEELMKLFTGSDLSFVRALQGSSTSSSSTFQGGLSEPKQRLMVLAIDEAKALLPELGASGWFRILRKGLEMANREIRREREEADSGIFAIFVGTNSTISHFASSAVLDPSHRVPTKNVALFPPFVLTHTIDVHHATTTTDHHEVVPDRTTRSTLDRYKTEVIRAIQALPRRESWNNLRRLGRPLWLVGKHRGKPALTELAADKLMGDRQHGNADSFNASSLNGVAAMLCRLGIRPLSSSSLAPRLVADFMAALSYVSHTQDHFIASYSSDPILTLGAVRVWQDSKGILATKILPQLRRLFGQQEVDTSDVSEVVARIVLLLAMDSCAELTFGHQVASWVGAGEFFSVWAFLVALHGDSPALRAANATDDDEEIEDASAASTVDVLHSLKLRWKDWSVSFTHFVQLVELPSEDCLWGMLGRRAAGIMPRGERAVDLVIPICAVGTAPRAEARVSMIVVQVENRSRGDTGLPGSTAFVDRPGGVFIKKTTSASSTKKVKLAELDPDVVLRVYISLPDKGQESQDEAKRFYVEDRFAPDRTSHVLCLKGLGAVLLHPPSPGLAGEMDGSATPHAVQILTVEVVKELQKLLSPWWNVRTSVEQDLDDRAIGGSQFAVVKEELMNLAMKPGTGLLVLNTDTSEMSAESSRLGDLAASEVGGGRSENDAGSILGEDAMVARAGGLKRPRLAAESLEPSPPEDTEKTRAEETCKK